MTNLRKEVPVGFKIDVEELYDRFGGVPHRESIEAGVEQAFADARAHAIADIVEQFDIRGRREAKS